MSFDSLEAAGAPPLEIYEITQGASVWRETSADETVTYDGHDYVPSEITRGPLADSSESSGGALEIRLPRTHPVAALLIGPPPATPITIVLRQGHRGDANWAIAFTGQVLTPSFDKDTGLATLQCASAGQFLNQQSPGYYYQWPCGHVCFSELCGLVAADYRVSATVTAVDSLSVTAAAFAGYPDGYFNAGWVEDALGRRRFITSHVGETVTLSEPLPDLEVAAALQAFPGCDGFESTCEAKFGNLVNHLGFPRIPTRNPFQRAL